MQGVRLAEFTVFLHFETILHGSLVFRRVIVTSFAFRAGQGNDVSHDQPTLA